MGFGASLWQELLAGLPGNVEMARIVVRLGVAMALGCFLGMERAHAGKAAGTRTHMLVTLGAALVVMLPQLAGMSSADASRVIQGTLTGIGFIGGGVILKMNDQHQIVGITTASSIWLTATVGIAAGVGRLGLAVVSAILAFFILTIFGRFEHRLIANHAAQKAAGGSTLEMRPDRVF
jgi:putative Mg2+ transporter-C (MgtC) family protein